MSGRDKSEPGTGQLVQSEGFWGVGAVVVSAFDLEFSFSSVLSTVGV